MNDTMRRLTLYTARIVDDQCRVVSMHPFDTVLNGRLAAQLLD